MITISWIRGFKADAGYIYPRKSMGWEKSPVVSLPACSIRHINHVRQFREISNKRLGMPRVTCWSCILSLRRQWPLTRRYGWPGTDVTQHLCHWYHHGSLLSFWSPTDLTNWECYLEIPAKKYLPYRQPRDVGGLAGYLAGRFSKRCCKYLLWIFMKFSLSL